MKRYSFFLALAAMLVLSFGLANGQLGPGAIYVSDVQGGFGVMNHDGTDTLQVDEAIVWTLKLHNANAVDSVRGSNNGFRIYSPDGATWQIPSIVQFGSEFVINYGPFGFAYFLYHATTNNGMGGVAAGDTVGIGGFAGQFTTGFLPGYNQEAIVITIPAPGIPVGDTGKTLCLAESGYEINAIWLWAHGGAVTPVWGPLPTGYGGPLCYTLFKVPNQPPDITPCPASFTISHCTTSTFQFAATDPDTLGARPLTFVKVSGPGTVSSSGMWSYSPTLANVGTSLSLIVRAQDDVGNLGPPCTTAVNVTNIGPSFTAGCGSNEPVAGGQSASINLTAVDGDCDPIFYSILSISPATTVVGAITVGGNGVVTFNTDLGDNDSTFTVCVIVTDTDLSDTCCVTFEVLSSEPYQVRIEKTHGTIQGGHEIVDVCLEKGTEPIQGFDFLIAYDASVLSFQTALEGNAVYDGSGNLVKTGLYGNHATDECGWEYFEFRFGPSGNCQGACPSGKLRVLGLAEINNGANHPNCFTPSPLPAQMFALDFLVTNDRTFECQFAPIRVCWLDCGDNTIAFNSKTDTSGFKANRLAMSRFVIDFDLIGNIANGNVGFPTLQGAQDECLDGTGDPNKPVPVRFIDFFNGGIDIICADSIDDRGDLNLNGVAHEVADAVLFTNYFIYGISVFENLAASVAASDVNADGLTLSVADLVYLIRIVLGDALPFSKTVPVEAVYTVNVNGTLEVDIEVGAVALQLQGNVEPTLLADNMNMEYAFDAANNVTRVLIYNSTEKGQSFTGEFINTNGSDVISIEMATYEGAPIIAKEVELPTEFALNQNYPNPFNPSTIISFALPTASNYTLTIYNVAGQKVADFAGNAEAGIVNVEWDASSQASGVYFYRVVADSKDGQFKETKKMVLLK